MTALEQLILEVQATGLDDVNKRLDQLDAKTKGATSSWKGLIASIAGLAGSAALIKGIVDRLVDATKTYQQLNAELVTATGSQEGATAAMDALLDIALKTANTLEDTTAAFVKLRNLGLDPSEKALLSYSNTATAQGRSIESFIDAVAKAQVGMYRGLEEFGIKAVDAGNQLIFTFQGQATAVNKSQTAIEAYLQSIGNTKFADATTNKLKTLGAQITILGVNWQQLWIDLAKEGPDSVITASVQRANAAVQEFSAMLLSGQAVAAVKGFGAEWSFVGDDVKESLDFVTTLIKSGVALWGSYFGIVDSDWKEIIDYLPAYLKGTIDIMASYFVKFVLDAENQFELLVDEGKNRFDELVAIAAATGTAMSSALHGHFNTDLGKTLSDIVDQYAALNAQIGANHADTDKVNQTYLEQALADIGKEINLRKANIDQITAETEKLREQYDESINARRAQAVDPLAGFKTTPGDDPNELKREADLQNSLLQTRLKMTEQGVQSENTVIMAGYADQKKFILADTRTTNTQKADLVLALLSTGLTNQLQLVKDNADAEKNYVMSSTELSEQQKTALVTALTKSREEQVRKIEQDSLNTRLDQASQFFGNIASIGSTFGKKGFAIAKAAAIAQATIDTYKAATSAYSSLAGIPYIGPELGIAAAAAAVVAGAANIAKIKSETYQGAMATGGMIGAGRYAVVGETGPEIVQGPAFVTGANYTKTGQGGGGTPNVTIHNMGTPVQASASITPEGMLVILKPLLAANKEQTKKDIATEIQRGGGTISKGLENVYQLKRQGI